MIEYNIKVTASSKKNAELIIKEIALKVGAGACDYNKKGNLFEYEINCVKSSYSDPDEVEISGFCSENVLEEEIYVDEQNNRYHKSGDKWCMLVMSKFN